MSTDGTPRRSIGLATAIGLVVGEMIGVGIFLTPAGMAKGLGTFLCGWMHLLVLDPGTLGCDPGERDGFARR